MYHCNLDTVTTDDWGHVGFVAVPALEVLLVTPVDGILPSMSDSTTIGGNHACF